MSPVPMARVLGRLGALWPIGELAGRLRCRVCGGRAEGVRLVYDQLHAQVQGCGLPVGGASRGESGLSRPGGKGTPGAC